MPVESTYVREVQRFVSGGCFPTRRGGRCFHVSRPLRGHATPATASVGVVVDDVPEDRDGFPHLEVVSGVRLGRNRETGSRIRHGVRTVRIRSVRCSGPVWVPGLLTSGTPLSRGRVAAETSTSAARSVTACSVTDSDRHGGANRTGVDQP